MAITYRRFLLSSHYSFNYSVVFIISVEGRGGGVPNLGQRLICVHVENTTKNGFHFKWSENFTSWRLNKNRGTRYALVFFDGNIEKCSFSGLLCCKSHSKPFANVLLKFIFSNHFHSVSSFYSVRFRYNSFFRRCCCFCLNLDGRRCNGDFRANQYDIKYSGHENRPKNLLLKSVTTNVPSQDLILGSYFTNSNNSCSSTATATTGSASTAATTTTGIGGGGGGGGGGAAAALVAVPPFGTLKSTSTAMVTAVAMGPPTTTTTTTASANATSIDLDINVHAIKNMLMATRVPESCV